MSKGFKSTEFWLTLAGLVGAVYLASTGADTAVVLAVAAGPGAYSVSRGIAKQNGGG